MARTGEAEIGLAVMEVLASEPDHEADVRTLIARVPEFVNLTDDDRQPSKTRDGEELWEQIVRNLQSHHKAEGNIIAEGWVEHLRRGQYRLTEAGLTRISNK
jgi:hypothetical protein